MKTKKHLLSMLLALCLMLVTMSMTAFAAPGETTPVVVIGNSDGTGIELKAITNITRAISGLRRFTPIGI